MATTAQEDADNTMAAATQEGADNAVMAHRVGSTAAVTSDSCADIASADEQQGAEKQQQQIAQQQEAEMQQKQTVQQQEAKKQQQEEEPVASAEDSRCLIAFRKEEEPPDWMRIATPTTAKMEATKGNSEHQHVHKTAVSAQLQCIIARLCIRTAARISIGNKRFGNYHMAAGDAAASER